MSKGGNEEGTCLVRNIFLEGVATKGGKAIRRTVIILTDRGVDTGRI